MKKTIIKSLLLFFSVPLINSITFGLGTFIHQIHQSTITVKQFNSYQLAMTIIICLTIVSILVFETLYDTFKISNKTANLLYIGLFFFIAILTFDQFLFRPYEHTLTFLSIISLIFTRELINKLLPTLNIAHQ